MPIADKVRVVTIWNIRRYGDEVGSFGQNVFNKVLYLRIEARYLKLCIAKGSGIVTRILRRSVCVMIIGA